jgi:hypothetical protein
MLGPALHKPLWSYLVTAILAQTVKLYDGFPPGTGIITIGDDNSFLLTKVDPATNQPIATLITSPINGLTVRGRGTMVRFRTATTTKAVDFSLGSELIRNDFGIAGDIAGGVLAGKSGVKPVIDALRKGGATVRYLTYWQRRALNWAIALGFFVIIILIIVVAVLAQR